MRQAILDASSSPYAQLLASSSLIKVVTEHTMASQAGGDPEGRRQQQRGGGWRGGAAALAATRWHHAAHCFASVSFVVVVLFLPMPQVKLEMRSYFLNYLDRWGPLRWR